jgi:glycine cleavage system regulatory protein
MDKPFVFTVIGPDRPGIVERMSDIVAAHGGNWLDSRLAALAGRFVGATLITVPEENAENFSAALKELETSGLRVMLEPALGAVVRPHPSKLVLKLVGHDHPGIVREISRVLHRHGISIDELNTGTDKVPMSGETFFRASAELQVPEGFSLEKLRDDLEALSHEIMVDLDLKERKI